MTEKGRAAVYLGRGQPFGMREYPIPEPEPGALVVRISRANICGSDLHMWRGDLDLAALGAPLPAILGHEMTGTVAKLGDTSTTDSTGQPLAVGDRVVYRYFYPCGCCPACVRGNDAACPMNMLYIGPSEPWPHFVGAYAEYYYVKPKHNIFKVPDDLSDDLVSPANCALSEVIYGLERVKLSFGETVVIQGAGGLGINAIAVAREMGAGKIIVIDGIRDRLDLAESFGADEVIDMKEYCTAADRTHRVKELTGWWGADVVAELAGYPEAIPEGLAMLGNGGRYLEIGNISLGMTCGIDPSSMVIGSKQMHCVVMYGQDTLGKALRFLSRNKDKYPFHKILSHTYPLEEINQAFEDQNRGLVKRAAIIP